MEQGGQNRKGKDKTGHFKGEGAAAAFAAAMKGEGSWR